MGRRGVNRVHDLWLRWQRWPLGRWLFSKAVGRMAPYTGTISPRVVALEPGYAKVEMRDQRGIRNHLDSIHAIAQMNLAEVTSGLAMSAALPADARGIITALSIDYVKKARGRLTAECRCPPPEGSEEREYEIEAVVRDPSGEIVSRATARWLIGPRR